ncbi:serine carboxypeptidase-like 17 [Phoenix dactylifera]|uniref:Serine carboxypeptidase-like 17 n=1 Tax=Phoenix dactylifera TaxID=42345 RepID=A0A8B8J4N7_PHODC|nr:serine carboxypeptidase-like 17 [Phoenix dactylifera]
MVPVILHEGHRTGHSMPNLHLDHFKEVRTRPSTSSLSPGREEPKPTMSPLLRLLLCCCSCWPPVLSAITVSRLPGFRGALPFYLETGYATVDEVNDSQLFYYFIKSEGNPEEDPLLLWLSGGPGCSSFSALAFEIGPVQFEIAEYNGSLPTLVLNPYSWTKVSNIIFLDSPIGTGFSFSRSTKGYEVGDVISSKQIYTFLRKWFKDHPRFLSNPLYIAGDSYGGKIVPVVAQEISQGIETGQQPLLNLKGYLIGNPLTGERIDVNSRVPYACQVGIISDELYELTEKNCEGEDYEHPVGAQCVATLEVVAEFFQEIDYTHILAPKCSLTSLKPKAVTGDRRILKENHDKYLIPPPAPALGCKSYAHYLSYYWANNHATKEALHIQKGTVGEWLRCNYELPYKRDIPSNVKYHRKLTSEGYRALVYSGDHDLAIPFLGTKEWIKSLDYFIVDDWRSWHAGGQVAGYTRTYSNNLTFATVKGAGHTAPEYRPNECLAMFKRWINHKPL